jgi:hypothetical protein
MIPAGVSILIDHDKIGGEPENKAFIIMGQNIFSVVAFDSHEGIFKNIGANTFHLGNIVGGLLNESYIK